MPETSFDFDDETIFELTHGDCWFLASALRTRLKLPYAIIQGDDQMQHVGIELPNGDIVDVEGVWESSQWLAKWEEELSDVWEVYLAEPNSEDENYHLLYPSEEDAVAQEAVPYGGENLALSAIADRIVSTINSL